MKRLLLTVALSAVALFQSLANVALAQDTAVCGDPPPVANERLKAEIEGRARGLAGFLGTPVLKGELEQTKTEIFSKYPNAEESRSNAYFEYIMCVLIFSSEDLSDREKIDEMVRIRNLDSTSNYMDVEPATDRNHFFVPQVVSAVRAGEGRKLMITLKLTNISPQHYYIAWIPNSGALVDDNASYCEPEKIRGFPLYSCKGTGRRDEWSSFDKGTQSTLILSFYCDEEIKGNTITLTARMCIKGEKRRITLPISLRSIPLQD